MAKVRALRLGFAEGKLQQPGDEFDDGGADASPDCWYEPVKPAAKPKKPEAAPASGPEGADPLA